MSDTRGSGNWATESTLLKVAHATENSYTALEKLVGKMARGQDPVSQVTRGLKSFDKALGEQARSAKEHVKTYKESQQELADTLQKRKRDNANRAAAVSGFVRSLNQANTAAGSMLPGAITGIARLGAGIPVVGAALAGLGAIIGTVVQQLFTTKDTFTTMVQSGILFNGSLVDFNVKTARAGLSVEEFAAVAQQSSGAIRALGETRFLNATTQLSRTFIEFGLSIQQGTEYFGEYLETQRLSGLYYEGVRGREIEAFQESIKQQQMLATLTGATVAEQRRAARARADSARYRAQMAAMDPAERARIDTVSRGLSAANIPQEMIEAAINHVIFGRTSREYSRMMAAMPEMTDAMNRMVATGTRESVITDVQGVARQYGATMADPDKARQILNLFDTSMNGTADAILRMQPAMTAINNLNAETIAQLERLRNGPPMDEATQGVVTATNAINSAMRSLNGTLVDFVARNGLGWLLESINSLDRAFTAFLGTEGNNDPAQRFRRLAESLGAGERGTAVATAFDTQGIWAGIGSAISNVLGAAWDALIAKLTEWSNKLVQQFYSILPSWARGTDPNAAAVTPTPAIPMREVDVARMVTPSDPTQQTPTEMIATERAMEERIDSMASEIRLQQARVRASRRQEDRDVLAAMLEAQRAQNALLEEQNRILRGVQRNTE